MVFSLCLLGAAVGRAQGPSEPFEPPPPPEEHAPVIAGEVHLDVVFPFADRPLCPPGDACVFGGGGGIGGLVEWRYPTGWAIGAGYDVWLLDGNGVHELSTLQALRFVARRFFLRERQLHPFVGAAIGGLLFGDAFRRNAGGGLVDVFAGFELEIVPTLAFVVGVGVRLFATSAFTSRSDEVERAQKFGVDGAAMLQVGLALTRPSPTHEAPMGPPPTSLGRLRAHARPDTLVESFGCVDCVHFASNDSTSNRSLRPSAPRSRVARSSRGIVRLRGLRPLRSARFHFEPLRAVR